MSAQDCLQHWGYHLTAVAFGLWVLAGARFFAKHGIAWRSTAVRGGALFALAITAAIFFGNPPAIRILDDEILISATAKALHLHKQAVIAIDSAWQSREFVEISSILPLRPLGFPFLLSLVHAVKGFHLSNVFVLNALATFGFFWILAATLWRRAGWIAAAVAVLLVWAQPVVSLTATSGGLEMASLALFAAFIALTLAYLEKPAGESAAFAFVTLLWFGIIRYESMSLLAPVAVILFFAKAMRKEHLKALLPYAALSLVFLLPLVWGRMLPAELYGMGGKPKDAPSFSPMYFGPNAAAFVHAFYTRFGAAPFAQIVNWGFVLALGAGLVAKRRTILGSSSGRTALLLILAATVWQCLVYFLFYAGSADTAVTARLFLFAAVGHSIGLALLLPLLFSQEHLPLAIAASLAASTAGSSLDPDVQGRLEVKRRYDAVQDFLATKAEPYSLLISFEAGYFTVQNQASVSYKFAQDNWEKVLRSLRGGDLSAVYFHQVIDRTTAAAREAEVLPVGVPTQEIFRSAHSPESTTVIRKLVLSDTH